MRQKIALKHKKNLRKQINGKFNNIGSPNENKKRSL
jgi:isocitrate dehydrogenase